MRLTTKRAEKFIEAFLGRDLEEFDEECNAFLAQFSGPKKKTRKWDELPIKHKGIGSY